MSRTTKIGNGTVFGGYVLAVIAPLFGFIAGIYLMVKSRPVNGAIVIILSFMLGSAYINLFTELSPAPRYVQPVTSPPVPIQQPAIAAEAQSVSAETPAPVGQIRIEWIAAEPSIIGLDCSFRVSNASDQHLRLLMVNIEFYDAENRYLTGENILITDFAPGASEVKEATILNQNIRPARFRATISDATTIDFVSAKSRLQVAY